MLHDRFWFGATKTEGDNDVRWMSNNASIDPTKAFWESDPRKDIGQFYAKRQNVSCLLISPDSWFGDGPEWGYKTDDEHPIAQGICEKPIV